MKPTTLLALAAVVIALPATAAINKGIEGSPHDFSTNSWNTRKGTCSPCHSAHNTDPSQVAPLWNHATSTGPFTPYSSPSLTASVGAPSGPSLACLSCHDGTLAVNQGMSGFNATNVNNQYIDPGAQIGPDLHVVHPVSFTYDANLAATDGTLENPTVYKIGDPKTLLTINTAPVPATWDGTSLTGKTIDQALLKNHKMECGSCHDVHKLIGSAPSSGIMVKISGTDSGGRGSLICRTCHIK